MEVMLKKLGSFSELSGSHESVACLVVTGLKQGADNKIPHGLARTPRTVGFRPRGAGGWHEMASPDRQNIYLHVEAYGPTSFAFDVWY